jgi:hypothetical protein
LGEESGWTPRLWRSRERLDEAFENIVVIDEPSPQEDDWMPGEFDIT